MVTLLGASYGRQRRNEHIFVPVSHHQKAFVVEATAGQLDMLEAGQLAGLKERHDGEHSRACLELGLLSSKKRRKQTNKQAAEEK